MDYPTEFDATARAKIVVVEIESNRKVLDQLTNDPGGGLHIDGTSFYRSDLVVFLYVLNVFKAYAAEACALGRSGIWGADKIDSESRKVLKRIALEAQAKYHPRSDFILTPMVEVGSIVPAVMEFFERCPQWQEYQTDLLEVAKFQAKNLTPPHMPIPLHIEPVAVDPNPQQGNAMGSSLVPVDRAEVRRAFVQPKLDDLGITPSGWAKKAGLHPSIVYDYLNGVSRPRPRTVKDLAQALGVKPSDLPK